MGVIQEIDLILSKTAITELNRQLDEASRSITQTIEKAVNAGGADQKARDAAIARVRALKTELDREARSLQGAVEKGLLGAKEAAVLGQDAGKAYGTALAAELTRAQKAGVLTRTDLAVLAKQVGGQTGLGKSLFDLAPPDLAPFEGFFGKIKGLALGVGGAIAGIFALGKLKDFARDSIREFLKDAQQLDDLRSTVQGLGLDFTQLRPQIDAASDAFVKAGRGSGSDFQRVLQQLSLTSGDYQKSLANVTLVSDLAAAKQISLEQATTLVGRAMIGQVEPLRRMGIEVKKGEDGVLALNKAVGGFIERQGPSWARSTTALANVWRDLKSAIGEALLTAGGGTSTFDSLAGTVQGLTKYIRENKEVLGDLGKAIVAVAGFLAHDLVESIRQAEHDLMDIGAAFDTVSAAYQRFLASLSRGGANISDFLGRTDFAATQRAEADRLDADADRLEKRAADRKARVARLEQSIQRDAMGLSGVESGASSDRVTTATPGGAVRGAINNPRGEGGSRTGHEKDALQEEIRLLSEAVKLDSTKAEATARLRQLEDDLAFTLAKGNLTFEARVGLEKKLHDVREALGEETVLTNGSVQQQIDFLTKLLPVTETNGFAVTELTRRQAAYRKELEGLVDPKRRLEIIQGLDEIHAALEGNTVRQNRQQRGGQPGALPGGVPAVDPAAIDQIIRNTDKDIASGPVGEALQKGTESIKVDEFFRQQFGEDFQQVVSDAAGFIGDEFGAVFERLFSDGENLIDLFGDLGKGLAAGLLKEIAQLAGAKSKENIAEAIEETAEGFAALFLNPPKAAAHFKSAALHTAAAVAWGALGGAAGAGGNSLSQGGGGGGNDLRDRPSDQLQPGGRGQAQLIIMGGDFFDLSNRRTLDQFAKAMSLVGDYDVVIRRGAA